MPTGASPPFGTTGYIYAETWPKPYGSYVDSEAGFQYSPTYKWYTFYIKASYLKKPIVYQLTTTIPELDSYSIGVIAYPLGTPTYGTGMGNANCATVGCIAVTLATNCPSNACQDDYVVLADDLYTTNNLVSMTMTTIAESPSQPNFNTGYEFGANQITSALTNTLVNGFPNYGTSFSVGGTQNWPNDTSRIIATGVSQPTNGPSRENDTIDLHK